MAPLPGPAGGSSKPLAQSQPQPEQEEEITDLVAFQSSLDDSVSAVRSLVDSWLPKDLDASWDAPDTNSFANATLASRARPARLGLGASVTAFHLQQAEDNKLRQRLLSKAKGTKRGAEEEQGPNGSTANGASKEVDSDDEEEDSRSKAFKPKAKGGAHVSNGVGGSKTSGASSSLSTPKKGTSSKPLFNPPTPSHPSPSTSALPTATPPHVKVKKEIPLISFYGGASTTPASSSAIPPAPLSKNKRKKERERERTEATKRQKLEEVLAEERADAAKETEDVVMESPQVTKHRTVKPPFAPSPSSGGDSPAAEVQEHEKDVDAEDGDDSDREADSVDGSGVVGNGAGNGEGLKKKKKKRRKKKGGKGGREGGAPAPVLNLGTPQS